MLKAQQRRGGEIVTFTLCGLGLCDQNLMEFALTFTWGRGSLYCLEQIGEKKEWETKIVSLFNCVCRVMFVEHGEKLYFQDWEIYWCPGR